jgi:hypothetical protein
MGVATSHVGMIGIQYIYITMCDIKLRFMKQYYCIIINMLYYVLVYSIILYYIMFYSVLFYSILFYSILFYDIRLVYYIK